MSEFCKDCLHQDICEYRSIIDKEVNCKNFLNNKFCEEVQDLTSIELLNYYRNLYHSEPLSTERGKVSNALNDLFSTNQITPCSIGDTFYELIKHDTEIEECVVSGLTLKANGTWKIRLTSKHYRGVFEIMISEIGTIVFRTREDAKRMLRKI